MSTKIKQLIESGLSKEFLKNLSEGQINQLYKRMVSEQVTPLPPKQSYKIGPEGGQLPKSEKGYAVKKNPDNTVTATPMESELDEDETDDVTDSNALGATALQDYTGQEAPHDANDMAPDGMDDDSDDDRKMMGMAESKSNKKSKYNPWAICTSSVGRDDKKKYERCVMDVKRNIREGKNPYQVIVEMSLEKMIEKHISPRMTKKDLLNTLSEQGMIRRPMTHMMIGFVDDKKMDKPVGKGYTLDMKEQGTKTAPPVVKPGTKEKPKTSDPFKNPKHQPKPKALDKPAKKMGTVEIPDYLTFDQLKINFKDQ